MRKNEKSAQKALPSLLIFATVTVSTPRGPKIAAMSTAFIVMMVTAATATCFTFHFVVRLVVAMFFVVFLLAALLVVALAMRLSASATHEPHPLLIVTSTKYVGEGALAWYTCLLLSQNQRVSCLAQQSRQSICRRGFVYVYEEKSSGRRPVNKCGDESIIA
ncbi:hypothetical protein EN829_035755 [Mesorhizobium sp. M00.F.Ca.ET.186.01.1.1]|nr:hypothetical protein EN829_035755 [Mesorhizobium sp. M00.F.Ca.ET.186.01.1.1]